MHPVLFEIPILGGLKIHSYGLMMALGFLAALAWIRFQSKREGLSPGRMTDLAFWMIVAAIVGSRLLYIFLNLSHFLKNPAEIFMLWEGGLVFLGGLLGCMVVALYYVKKNGYSFWLVADVFMPGVALGHAFGRLGCFLAGCCYGKACDLSAWYGVRFPAGGLAPTGMALYPTQVLEAGTEFLTFLFLAWKSQRKGFDGQIFLLYLILYSLFRFGIELLRGDIERGFVIAGWLSTSQLIGILLIMFALIMLFYRKGRSS